MNSTDGKNEKGLRARLSRIRTIQDRFPFPLVAGLLVLVILIEIIFCILMISLGILPGQYVALVIVILLVNVIGAFVPPESLSWAPDWLMAIIYGS